jgi:hypothetical protein
MYPFTLTPFLFDRARHLTFPIKLKIPNAIPILSFDPMRASCSCYARMDEYWEVLAAHPSAHMYIHPSGDTLCPYQPLTAVFHTD